MLKQKRIVLDKAVIDAVNNIEGESFSIKVENILRATLGVGKNGKKDKM
jgi:hypothetical protein